MKRALFPSDRQQGFTLVEMAVVLIVFGLFASTILMGLRFYNAQERQTKTDKALEESKEALIGFYNDNNRYPCPASFDAGEDGADYGFEVISSAGLSAMEYDGRDIDNDDGDNDPDSGGEPYVVGAVPFKTILDYSDDLSIIGFDVIDKETGKRFAGIHSIDGHGQKLAYAVTRSLCDPANPIRDLGNGVLDVVNEEEVSILPEGKLAHFVVMSYGENGLGAYTKSGDLIDECMGSLVDEDEDAEEAPPDDGGGVGDFLSDEDNCKYNINNGLFFSGLRSVGSDIGYFDDEIYFHYGDIKRIWVSASQVRLDNGTPDNPDDDIFLSRIRNENDGFVGVGTSEPKEMLHVEGDIQAIEVIAEEYCDASGTCMPAEVLAGELSSMRCPDGLAIKRIQNNSVECEDPFEGMSFSCASGFYLQGMRSDGTPVCVAF